MRLWKMHALLASVSRTQLITSGVKNRLLPYVKISYSHRSNSSPHKYSYSSQLANCLTPHSLIESTVKIWNTLTLVDFQLDAQNSYLFSHNTFIKILYMFRALPCSSSGGLRRNCIYAASGIVTVCRWLSCAPVKKELFFLNGAQDSQLQ